MKCKTCPVEKDTFGPGDHIIVSYQVIHRVTTPDGISTVTLRDAGEFCSDKCLVEYLTKKEAPHAQLTLRRQRVCRESRT